MKTLLYLILIIFLASCEKEESYYNAPVSKLDSIVIWKNVPGPVYVEIDDINSSWVLNLQYTVMDPYNGYPEHEAYIGHHYIAYSRESNMEYIFIEEGKIGQVTIIDGISWN